MRDTPAAATAAATAAAAAAARFMVVVHTAMVVQTCQENGSSHL